MIYKDAWTNAQIKRAVDIEREGAPVLPMEYSTAGRRFRVEHIEITYRWKDSFWVVESWSQVDLTGTVLKKDGTDSKNKTTRTPIYGWPRNPDIYPWLSNIVDRLRPSTDLIMATGTFETPWEDED